MIQPPANKAVAFVVAVVFPAKEGFVSSALKTKNKAPNRWFFLIDDSLFFSFYLIIGSNHNKSIIVVNLFIFKEVKTLFFNHNCY